jgi:hypothetical protein
MQNETTPNAILVSPARGDARMAETWPAGVLDGDGNHFGGLT